MNMLDDVYIRMVCAKHAFKESAKEKILSDQRGNAVIETVIIIAVVLVIAALFWDELVGFVSGLMDSVFGDDSTGSAVNDKINNSKPK